MSIIISPRGRVELEPVAGLWREGMKWARHIASPGARTARGIPYGFGSATLEILDVMRQAKQSTRCPDAIYKWARHVEYVFVLVNCCELEPNYEDIYKESWIYGKKYYF